MSDVAILDYSFHLSLCNASYQLTNEQAQGLVSKRDFINLTARRVIDGVTLLAAQACLYPQMPLKDK